MDNAFNKNTNKIVPGWAIYKDTSYILPKDDVWHVNPDEVENYEEILQKEGIEFIECRYKEGHDRQYTNKEGEGDITFVIPHFFIPNREKRGIKLINETEDHKRLKNFIFNIISEKIHLEFSFVKINQNNQKNIVKIKLKDLDINWENLRLSTKEDFLETSIVDIFNTRRVDVLFPFNKKDPILGYGLAFEVQLSKQSAELQKKRTIDRALKGFSTIWLDKTHFEDNSLNLKSLEVNIYSWQSVLHHNAENIENNILEKIQRYSREIEEKIKNTNMAGHKCPSCEKGILTLNKGKYGSFLGCTDFKNGCKFTVRLE